MSAFLPFKVANLRFNSVVNTKLPVPQTSFSRNIMRIRACAKNVTNSANKFYIAALNFPKSVQLFQYNLFVPKHRLPILNFLTICTKLRPKNSTNLSALKLQATHGLKTSKLQLPYQKIYYFPIQKNHFLVWA